MREEPHQDPAVGTLAHDDLQGREPLGGEPGEQGRQRPGERPAEAVGTSGGSKDRQRRQEGEPQLGGKPEIGGGDQEAACRCEDRQGQNGPARQAGHGGAVQELGQDMGLDLHPRRAAVQDRERGAMPVRAAEVGADEDHPPGEPGRRQQAYELRRIDREGRRVRCRPAVPGDLGTGRRYRRAHGKGQSCRQARVAVAVERLLAPDGAVEPVLDQVGEALADTGQIVRVPGTLPVGHRGAGLGRDDDDRRDGRVHDLGQTCVGGREGRLVQQQVEADRPHPDAIELLDQAGQQVPVEGRAADGTLEAVLLDRDQRHAGMLGFRRREQGQLEIVERQRQPAQERQLEEQLRQHGRAKNDGGDGAERQPRPFAHPMVPPPVRQAVRDRPADVQHLRAEVASFLAAMLCSRSRPGLGSAV